MKKIITLILSLLYIITSSGVTINKHFCMGEFVQWNFSHNKEKNCSNCGMNETESKGCCDNQQKILKIDKEQKITNATYQFPPITSPALNPPFFEIACLNIAFSLKKHTQSNALHRVQNLPLFILYSVFRI